MLDTPAQQLAAKAETAIVGQDTDVGDFGVRAGGVSSERYPAEADQTGAVVGSRDDGDVDRVEAGSVVI